MKPKTTKPKSENELTVNNETEKFLIVGVGGLASNLKKTRFAPEVETNLCRIAQEALNNTNKQAAAKTVGIVLERRDGLIALLIEDDGKGFDPQDKKNPLKGIGLIEMKERAQLIGGTAEVESAAGKGTTVYVRVPAETVKRKKNRWKINEGFLKNRK